MRVSVDVSLLMRIPILFWRRLRCSPSNNPENPMLELSGAGVPWTFRQLETWIKQLHPDLIFISDTKYLSRRIDNLRGRIGMFGVGVDAKAKRKETCNLLHKLNGMSMRPWLVAGDFNQILHHKEKAGRNKRHQWQLSDFRRCLDSCNLADIGSKGERFTWCNHMVEPYNVEERTKNISILRLCGYGWKSVKRWFGHTGPLLLENRPSRYCSRNSAVSGGSVTIGSMQLCECSAVDTELKELKEREKLLWKQRGKTQWLKEGDRNIAYFHHQALSQHRKNSISSITDDQSTKHTNMKDIQRVITQHFDTLFQSSSPSLHVINETLSKVEPIVSSEMNDTLLLPFTPEEHFWSLTGQDVVACVLEFFALISPPSFNSTNLVLIPKCDKPELVSHFRPISLCNVIYKIASNTIANRLKPLLPTIISESQLAFILGRLITDNVIIADETNHFLAHKYWVKEGHIALKLDIKVFSHMIQHEEARGVLQGVAQFEAASGLAINWQKSAALFNKNVDQISYEELGRVLGVMVVDRHEKHLGLPHSLAGLRGRCLNTSKVEFRTKFNIGVPSIFPKQGGRSSSKPLSRSFPPM
ncbi:UNVERIFIED_CONTAM: hypothetical protein Slati_4459700 [Sesamum latifolium]|uniref:Reverse transcriptase domain-containing protein n=1 Tax=Sesamum latifolium TaxID=2727402 RepID=A0AAW2SS16_9LAMI